MFLRLNPPFFALRGMDSAMNDTLDELTGSCRAETAACSGPSSSCSSRTRSWHSSCSDTILRSRLRLPWLSRQSVRASQLASSAPLRISGGGGGGRCDRPFSGRTAYRFSRQRSKPLTDFRILHRGPHFGLEPADNLPGRAFGPKKARPEHGFRTRDTRLRHVRIRRAPSCVTFRESCDLKCKRCSGVTFRMKP